MIEKFIGIQGHIKTFDCGHLSGKYLKDVLGLDFHVNAIPRNYPVSNERQFIISTLLNLDFIEIPVDAEYQKGDLIVYKASGVNRYCIATCIDSVQALVMKGRSGLIHIERIDDKCHHFRHKSLIIKESNK